MSHLVQAVDMVRKQEHRELKREGLGVLAGTKYLWLYSQENLPPEKRSLFSWLKKKRLKTLEPGLSKRASGSCGAISLWAGRPNTLSPGMPGLFVPG